ncbi:MAG: sulfotransferase [Xanthomonadales bacterium]|nr:sulfotransferase [Xanthomonadales bacterium]
MPTERRRPNLFLVGAQKSGTTTLAVMLANHPDVFMSSPKEPGYLAFGERGYTGVDGYGRLAHAASWVINSEDDYLDLYVDAPDGVRWLGDASTWYLSEPDAAERLHAFNPEAHIIAILRHPAERAYSGWCHARRDQEEPCESFSEALDMESKRENASHLLRYREMGRYAGQLRRYFDVFGKSRVLVLFYEDLRDEPEDLWRRCADFLSLDADARAPAAHRQNRSGKPRSRLLYKLMRSERFKKRMKQILPGRLAAWAKNRAEAVNMRRFPPMPQEQRRRLEREFAVEVRELMSLTGHDLTHWLPDE